MTTIKLKGLINLSQWSNHIYKLVPKQRKNDKENCKAIYIYYVIGNEPTLDSMPLERMRK